MKVRVQHAHRALCLACLSPKGRDVRRWSEEPGSPGYAPPCPMRCQSAAMTGTLAASDLAQSAPRHENQFRRYPQHRHRAPGPMASAVALPTDAGPNNAVVVCDDDAVEGDGVVAQRPTNHGCSIHEPGSTGVTPRLGTTSPGGVNVTTSRNKPTRQHDGHACGCTGQAQPQVLSVPRLGIC